jgi:hypothetical protein
MRLLPAAAVVAAAFVPLVVCLRAGTLSASLWLDEVLYYYLQSDFPLRASNLGMPGSRLAPYFGGYFFCDLQRLFQQVWRLFGVTIFRRPEACLRLLPLACFASSALLLVLIGGRGSSTMASRLPAVLAFSASPLMLYYAFEGRVFMFSFLLVVVFCALLEYAMRRSSGGAAVGAAAVGMIATHSEQWSACFLAVLALVGAVFFLRPGILRQRARILAMAVAPGLLLAAGEAAIFLLRGSGSGARFPQYERQNFYLAFAQTMRGPFGFWKCPGGLLSDIHWLPSIPETAFALALFFIVRACRRRWGRNGVAMSLVGAALYLSVPQFFGLRSLPGHDVDLFSLPVLVLLILFAIGVAGTRGTDRLLLCAAFGGVVLSAVLGSVFGFLFIPRYQVPLWGAVFYSLARLRGRVALGLVGALAFVELLLLPCTIPAILDKSAGRDIASMIRSGSTTSSAVIVQHAVRIGYPDPDVSFPVDFYLNYLHPNEPTIPIFELPDLREITGQKSSSRYLGSGRTLVRKYLTPSLDTWRSWLATSRPSEIWLVAPDPPSPSERRMREMFIETIAIRFPIPTASWAYKPGVGTIVVRYPSK